MENLERRLAWAGAKDAFLRSWHLLRMDHWEEALCPYLIGALYARNENGDFNPHKRDELASVLRSEIDAGTFTRIRATVHFNEGYATPARSIEVDALHAKDLVDFLGRAGFGGRYLSAWLAPYYQEAEIHQEKGEPASPTPMKRAAIINDLSRRYPSIESDFNRPAGWVQDCSTGKRGEYYLEKVKKACFEKWGEGNAPAALVATIRTHKIGG